MRIPTRIVPSIGVEAKSPARVARDFKALLAAGARLRPAGEAKKRPSRLIHGGYLPKYEIRLFGTTIYLTNIRQNPDLRFFVAYVIQGEAPPGRMQVWPRIFYKDVSLQWRSPSHLAGPVDDYWIGKGDVRILEEDGLEVTESMEETTDLPLEMQAVLDTLSRRVKTVPYDEKVVRWVLRRSETDRVRPYADFLVPRRRAAADPGNRIYGGRSVARFRRPDDPESLRFVRGYEPDFGKRGVIEATSSKSTMYGGRVRRFRILSKNRRIQYLFFAGPKHVWIIPPQAFTTELSSFALRTVDVRVDENLCVPGYEYHFLDHSSDPPALLSQIPEGHAGPPSEHDPSRADASPWLDRLPVVREFRRKVLSRFSKA